MRLEQATVLSTPSLPTVAHLNNAVFVPTDAEEGAGALYERLGFAPLAVQHHFTRRAD